VTEAASEPVGPLPDVPPAPLPAVPVRAEERITVIDCLRGAALLGILIANMRGFNAPLAAYMRPSLMWTWMPDRFAQALVDWLVSGKFITIFATLFGIGFAIQMDRAASRGYGASVYARRMAVLLLIGLVHAFGLWWGDILVPYAVCGFFLLLFRRRSQRALLIWGNALYWLLMVLFVGFYVATLFGVSMPQPPDGADEIQKTIAAYSTGSIRDVFVTRAGEWAMANSFVLFLTNILGIFVIGLYIWRQGYLRHPADHIDWWRRGQRLGLAVGLIGNFVMVAVDWVFKPNPMLPTAVTTVMMVVRMVAVPALSLGYASTIVLLWQNPAWQRRLMPFSYVGRMALTNYLMQSLICTTIFYSYGLGLYGRVGPLADLLLAFVIYGLQVPFSRWWLASHRYGPMEWVWRRLTYGRIA
jgi:uncharacterized protein